jgi:hypothetical protein
MQLFSVVFRSVPKLNYDQSYGYASPLSMRD